MAKSAEHGTLSAQVLHILLALVEGPQHGYAVMQSVADATGGQIRLGPGTVYGAFRRLLADGLIEEAGQGSEGGAVRRYYRLTGHGRSAVAGEARRLERIVETARALRVLPAGGG